MVRTRHQAITWTNVDFSLTRFCGIHLAAISSAQAIILNDEFENLKIILLEILPHLPGTNWLTDIYLIRYRFKHENIVKQHHMSEVTRSA